MHVRSVLFLDVMDTLVYDPFKLEMLQFFDASMEELLRDKSPDAWPRFERGEISEEEFAAEFFADGRTFDYPGLKDTLHRAYRMLPGIPELLDDLKQAGVEMHTLSNYPVWHQMIEEKLQLTRWLEWTFVSWQHGTRKPEPKAFERALELVNKSPDTCVFVDDRRSNCSAAESLGIHAIRFESADQLREALKPCFPELS